MATEGNLSIGRAPNYENYASLKKYIRSLVGVNWKEPQLHRFVFAQTGTGSYVEISEKGGLTITDIAAEGAVYAWEEADVAADRGKVITLEYYDADGDMHTGYAILDNTDTTTKVQFKTESGGSTAVSDYYRIRTADFENDAGKYIAIGNSGGSTVYGVIEEGNHQSIHSRYTVPKGYDAWLGFMFLASAVATRTISKMRMTFTPYNHSDEHHIEIAFSDNAFPREPCLRLQEKTEIKFEVLGNNALHTFDLHIIEVEQV